MSFFVFLKKRTWEYSLLWTNFTQIMADVAASAFPWFPLHSVARLKYKSNAFFVSEETTLQLIGTLDVACIATLGRPLQLRGLAPPPLTADTFRYGTDRMCTMYMNLAGTRTPYISMGLGIYYIATPETFAYIIKTGIEPVLPVLITRVLTNWTT